MTGTQSSKASTIVKSFDPAMTASYNQLSVREPSSGLPLIVQ